MVRSGRFVAVTMLTVVSLWSLALAAPPAGAASLRRQAVLHALNERRHAHGLRRLDMPRWVSRYAKHHSREMARRGTIFHTSDLGGVLSGVPWHEAGENVGAGGDWRSVMRAFMRSAEHRWNILHAAYRHVGVGLDNRRGSVFVTLFFYG